MPKAPQTLLHVGCGPKRKDRTTAGFKTPDWTEIRHDIDPAVRPDVTGTMTDMVASASVAALVAQDRLTEPAYVSPAVPMRHAAGGALRWWW